MSQAKVDRYKEQKRNRAKIMKKEKREWLATKIGLGAVALVMVGWVGMSVYTSFIAPKDTGELPSYTVNTSALDEYVSGLSVD